ncbi:LysR family transcriptional regulator substrate-binding protein [Gordonia sp. CPCC 205333]|uniref:LysR family transcriptional regulator substrate-binding protein n=1 Tax=Gordonia sp. CPCC 205333 TaxID=3140790 RepID=UPI003AF333EF
MTAPAAQPFRLAFVPGVTPAKWVRIWSERRRDRIELVACDNTDAALSQLSDGTVQVALVREPPAEVGLNVIPLYTETTVAVVEKEHLFTAVTEVALTDIADEPLLIPLDDPLTWPDRPGVRVDHRPATVSDGIQLVATGMGVLLVPQSLARLHHRRDVAYRPVQHAPQTPVALVWRQTSPQVEEFVGIVRGRGPNSSRGESEPAPKRTAREKMLAKRAAREAAGKQPPSPRKPRRPRSR